MLVPLRTIHLSNARPRTIDALSFREDGSLAMLCRNDPRLYAFDLESDSLRVLSECAGDVSNPSSRWRFSGDGASVIARSLDGAVLSTHAWNADQRVLASAIDARQQRLALATDADTIELYTLGR